MSNFSELDENLNTIIAQLITNDNLTKYLYYTDKAPLKNLSLDDPTILLDTNIFPFPFAPVTQTDASTIINVTYETFFTNEKSVLKDSYIAFSVFTHLDLWRLEDGLRPFKILHEIDVMFNGSREIKGLSKLELDNGRLMLVNEKYAGYQVKYKIVNKK